MDRSEAYEYFEQAVVLAQGSAEEAAKQAVLKARQPVKSKSEKRERDRAVLQAFENYRRLSQDDLGYWDEAEILEGILEHTDSMDFASAQAEFEEYAAPSSPARPTFFEESVERPDLSSFMAGSKFANTNNDKEN